MTNFTINEQTATDRIDEWQQEQATIKTALGQNPAANSNVLDIKAFTFKLEDIVEFVNRIYLANNPGGGTAWQMPMPTSSDTTNGIRFYVGEKETSNPNVLEPCLIAVAVDNFTPSTSGGSDVLDLPTAPGSTLVSQAIYDFSYPCPTTCPTNGGLGTS